MALEHRQSATAVLLLAISLMLAVSCYRQLAWYTTTGDLSDRDAREGATLNLFLSDQEARLQHEVAELERVLEFMVWPSVERPLRRRLLELYRQQANRSPFDGALWLKMLNQQSFSADREQQLDWILGRVLATSGWRHEAFVNLAYYCIRYEEILTTDTRAACNRLLAESVGQNRSRALPQVLGLSRRQVEQILQQAVQAP